MRHLMRRRTDVRSFFINPCMITQTSESFIWQLSGCRSDGWCELKFFSKRSDKNLPPHPQRTCWARPSITTTRWIIPDWSFWCTHNTSCMKVLPINDERKSYRSWDVDFDTWSRLFLRKRELDRSRSSGRLSLSRDNCRGETRTDVPFWSVVLLLRWRFLSSGLLILHLANRRQ
jgi:hypothetical protein